MNEQMLVNALVELGVVQVHVDYYEEDNGKPVKEWVSLKYRDGRHEEIEVNEQ